VVEQCGCTDCLDKRTKENLARIRAGGGVKFVGDNESGFYQDCPTIEEMIEEMQNTHICTGGDNQWWAYVEPWGVYEDGKGDSPINAVRALYKKWKTEQ